MHPILLGGRGAASSAQDRAVVFLGDSMPFGQGSSFRDNSDTGPDTTEAGLLRSDGGWLVASNNNSDAHSGIGSCYPGFTSAAVLAKFQSVQFIIDRYRWTFVIWMGRNDAGNRSQVRASIAAVVQALGHRRFLILPVLPQTRETDGTGGTGVYGTRPTIDLINGDIKADYPGNNRVDAIIASCCTDPGKVPPVSIIADFADHGDGTYGTHLNDTGQALVKADIVTGLSLLPASAVDTAPDAFSFVAQTGVTPGTTPTAALVTTGLSDGSSAARVTGINAAAPISVTGGQYQINGGSFTSSAGTVQNGDIVNVKSDANAVSFAVYGPTLTIGGVSATFSVTNGGAELVVNGGFDTDTTWAKTNATISGGTGNMNGSFPVLSQNIAFTAGKTYTITFTISGLSSGGVTPIFFGGTNRNGTTRSTNGTFTQQLVANTGNVSLRFAGSTSSTVLSIDNVSLTQLAP